jgi:ribonuclease HII
MIILAIRDSGRGALIGPMVMVAVSIDEKEEFKLDILGVRDKNLTKQKKKKLYEGIIEMIEDYKVKIIECREIDDAVKSDESNLNWMEADKVAEFINTIDVKKVIVDCPSNNLNEYKEYIKKKLNKETELIVQHKVDNKYLAAKASTIIAQIIREKEIEKIKKEHNIDFGSGYPSDPFTIQFLEKNYDKYPIFRKSWASWKRVALTKNQRKLGDF